MNCEICAFVFLAISSLVFHLQHLDVLLRVLVQRVQLFRTCLYTGVLLITRVCGFTAFLHAFPLFHVLRAQRCR